MLELSESEKLDVLKHVHVKANDQITYHRERQDKIFTWSSNIFLLVIAALLVIDQSSSLPWTSQGALGKVVASLAILVLLVFSVRWQQRNRRWQEESVEVVERIEQLFHCFDKGYFGTPDDITLFPERWSAPRDSHTRLSMRKRIFRVNYLSATVILGVLTIVMIWVSGV